MEWYLVVLVTLVVFWAVSIIWAQIDEDTVIYWACGLLYPILYVLFYPIRAMFTYERSRGYFEKHGISKIQYVLGKRVRRN